MKARAINRRSYMSAHVFMYLLNKLKKCDKMRGLLSILSLFSNEFNKFNNTGARMLDSILHMALKYYCKHVFGVKTSKFYHNRRRCYGHHFIPLHVPEISKPLVVYRFLCMALLHSQKRRHII